jgi:hypothetical protein
LKPKYDELLSNFACKFNLRRCAAVTFPAAFCAFAEARTWLERVAAGSKKGW